MATKLDDDQRQNPGQTHYNDEFNKIRQNEENGDFKDIADNYDKTADPTQEDKAIERARQRENQGDWKNNVTGGTQKTVGGGKAFFKKKGPVGAIVALVFGGGFGIATMFSGPSLILVHIYEEVTGDPRVNTQLTSMQSRFQQIIASKFSKATANLCSSTSSSSIICKFTRPSNYELAQMKEEGITPVDSEGHPITEGDSGLADQPDGLEYTDSSGASKTVSSGDIGSAMDSNPEFAADVNNSAGLITNSLEDHTFDEIRTENGFTGQDENEDAKNAEDVDKNLSENVSGDESSTDPSVKGTSSSESNETSTASEDATSALKNDVGEVVGDELKKVGEDASDDKSAVGMLAGVACAATDVPGMVVKVVRAYQVAQVIRYASVFLITAAAIKAGTATPTEVAALGTVLTTVVAGKTAMDSFGMRNLLMGDSGIGGDTHWWQAVPGLSATKSNSLVGAMSNISLVTSSSIKNQICSIANNQALWTGVDAATDETPAGWINTLLGWGAGTALALSSDDIASAIVNAIPKEVYAAIMGAIAGGILSYVSGGGMATGNTLASGAENMMSETANAGGNMPLTTSQAVAYGQVANQVQLAYAQEDRATHSPLDATNPNTALGSFVNQFMPYYADMTSVSGVLSMIGNVVGSSFSSIVSPVVAQAANPTYQYNQCEDSAIQTSHTAATPFCAVDYGIPTEWLNIPPTQVIQDLQASGNIDDSGNPIQPSTASQFTEAAGLTTSGTTLYTWMQKCTDGSESAINSNGDGTSTNTCMINDKQTAEYALYTIDHRIQKDIDGEDTTLVSGGTTNNSDGSSDSTSAYNQSNSMSNYIAVLNQLNQASPSIPKQQPQTQLASITTASVVVKQFFTNLPSKRANGVLV